MSSSHPTPSASSKQPKGTVHLLDYVAGNIRSLVNAIEKCNYSVSWITSPADVTSASKIILPGVGHFGHCLTQLSSAGYLPAIKEHIEKGKPFFGICVGLQALFEGSAEADAVDGMGIVEGALERFSNEATKDGRGRKSVPCIGWNSATTHLPGTDTDADERKLFYGLTDASKYYYVHSYFAPYMPDILERQGWTVATATYGDETYIGALGKGNVFATQFHPEKSGAAGLRVIKAFLEGKTWSSPALSTSSIPSFLTSHSEDEGTHNLTRRIIACLDVRTNDSGDLVVTKGDQYDVREKSSTNAVRNLGKPVDMAKRYYA
jgi:imidazole glycerol-phosphate synthase